MNEELQAERSDAPTRCLIAEDEPLLAAGLRAELAAAWPALEVVASVGDGLSAVTQTLRLRPEVCFFDIRLPGCSGLEAAQALAEDWPDEHAFPLIVFVTAYDDHALQAFEAQAVDYLRALLAPAAGTTPAGARLQVVQAQVGSVVHLVPVADVLYFEAADKYLRVVTADREHLIRLSLRELLPQLDPAAFWQVHRGTVVQARCIAMARREESSRVTLTLRGRDKKLVASHLYAHLFKGM